MSVVVPCPGCGKRLKVGEKLLGKRVKCPNCEKPIDLPKPEPASPVLEATIKEVSEPSREVDPFAEVSSDLGGLSSDLDDPLLDSDMLDSSEDLLARPDRQSPGEERNRVQLAASVLGTVLESLSFISGKTIMWLAVLGVAALIPLTFGLGFGDGTNIVIAVIMAYAFLAMAGIIVYIVAAFCNTPSDDLRAMTGNSLVGFQIFKVKKRQPTFAEQAGGYTFFMSLASLVVMFGSSLLLGLTGYYEYLAKIKDAIRGQEQNVRFDMLAGFQPDPSPEPVGAEQYKPICLGPCNKPLADESSYTVAFSGPKAGIVAVCGNDRKLRIFEIKRGRCVAEKALPSDNCELLDVSPEGNTAIVFSNDAYYFVPLNDKGLKTKVTLASFGICKHYPWIRFVDETTCLCIRSRGYGQDAQLTRFTPGDAGAIIEVEAGHGMYKVSDAGLSPGRRYVYTATHADVRVFQASDLTQVAQFSLLGRSHTNVISCVGFAPDGSRFGLENANETRFVDLNSARTVGSCPTTSDSHHIAWCEDGRTVIAGNTVMCDDGTHSTLDRNTQFLPGPGQPRVQWCLTTPEARDGADRLAFLLPVALASIEDVKNGSLRRQQEPLIEKAMMETDSAL